MKRRANWLAWSLQFIFGLVIGGLVGVGVLMRRNSVNLFWMSPNLVPYFLIGAALLGAGLASHYGDRLWLDDYIIPQESPKQSNLSRNCSFLAGAVGVGLMVYAVCRDFGWV